MYKQQVAIKKSATHWEHLYVIFSNIERLTYSFCVRFFFLQIFPGCENKLLIVSNSN